MVANRQIWFKEAGSPCLKAVFNQGSNSELQRTLNSLSLDLSSLPCKMEGWMGEFNVTFAWVRPNRQAGTMAMRQMALVARMKLSSNMAEPGIEPKS